jgi:hypothetical protein
LMPKPVPAAVVAASCWTENLHFIESAAKKALRVDGSAAARKKENCKEEEVGCHWP